MIMQDKREIGITSQASQASLQLGFGCDRKRIIAAGKGWSRACMTVCIAIRALSTASCGRVRRMLLGLTNDVLLSLSPLFIV